MGTGEALLLLFASALMMALAAVIFARGWRGMDAIAACIGMYGFVAGAMGAWYALAAVLP